MVAGTPLIINYLTWLQTFHMIGGFNPNETEATMLGMDDDDNARGDEAYRIAHERYGRMRAEEGLPKDTGELEWSRATTTSHLR